MHRIYGALIEIAASSVFIIPVFFIYGKIVFHNFKKTLWNIVFAFYLAAVSAVTGFPGITDLRLDVTINIVPFIGMASDFKNSCLNVLLFVPFGIFLPILYDKYRNVKSIIVAGLCVTAIIEIMQIFTFRASDINDIITNAAGTVAGYYIAKGTTKNFSRYIMPDSGGNHLYLVCGTVGIIMFLMQPFVSSVLWELIVR